MLNRAALADVARCLRAASLHAVAARHAVERRQKRRTGHALYGGLLASRYGIAGWAVTKRTVERVMRRMLLVMALIGLLLPACRAPQPTYVRGSEMPGLDDAAMGVGLDRRDLEQLLRENMISMANSRWFNQMTMHTGPRPTVAVMPMENWTTEHVEPQLHALIGMVETELVNSGYFSVVAAALREQILAELNLQQGQEFDQARAVRVGRQLGVQYFVTGRVVDNSERTATARRVQYFMFMQAISVETGEIVWQNRADLTKGIVPLR